MDIEDLKLELIEVIRGPKSDRTITQYYAHKITQAIEALIDAKIKELK